MSRKLTPEERSARLARVVAALNAGQSQWEIAAREGISVAAVCKFIARYVDYVAIARSRSKT